MIPVMQTLYRLSSKSTHNIKPSQSLPTLPKLVPIGYSFVALFDIAAKGVTCSAREGSEGNLMHILNIEVTGSYSIFPTITYIKILKIKLKTLSIDKLVLASIMFLKVYLESCYWLSAIVWQIHKYLCSIRGGLNTRGALLFPFLTQLMANFCRKQDEKDVICGSSCSPIFYRKPESCLGPWRISMMEIFG